MHSNGLVHCDIKPHNFLLFKQIIEVSEKSEDESEDRSGSSSESSKYFNSFNNSRTSKVKLCDFGLSHVIGKEGKVYLKMICGTMKYMAPEVKEVVK